MSEYLEFPDPTSNHPAIYALGRMTAAWGELEHNFFVILLSLFGASDITGEKHPETGRRMSKVDFYAAKALYFSQDSSRARRQMVVDLAKARVAEGLLHSDLCSAIIETAESARKASARRNIYSHTNLRFMKDGKIEIQAKDTMGENAPKRRAPSSEIDKITEEIRHASKQAFQLMIACLERPQEPPPTSAA
jgi:hypothetical protein